MTIAFSYGQKVLDYGIKSWQQKTLNFDGKISLKIRQQHWSAIWLFRSLLGIGSSFSKLWLLFPVRIKIIDKIYFKTYAWQIIDKSCSWRIRRSVFGVIKNDYICQTFFVKTCVWHFWVFICMLEFQLDLILPLKKHEQPHIKRIPHQLVLLVSMWKKCCANKVKHFEAQHQWIHNFLISLAFFFCCQDGTSSAFHWTQLITITARNWTAVE